jgi:hypothetical protein
VIEVKFLPSTCNRKVVPVKILSRGISQDKGERGTIESETEAEKQENTYMVVPMQVLQKFIDQRGQRASYC